jgi:hypothetical protein
MTENYEARADARFATLLGDDARLSRVLERAIKEVDDWLECGNGWAELEAVARAGNHKIRLQWRNAEVRDQVRDQFSEVVKAVIRTARKESPTGFIGTTTVALGVLEDLTRDLAGGVFREPSTPQELLMLIAEHAWRRSTPASAGLEALVGATSELTDRTVDAMVELAEGAALGLDDDEEDVLIFSILDHKYDDSVARISQRLNVTGEAVRETIRTLGARVMHLGG